MPWAGHPPGDARVSFFHPGLLGLVNGGHARGSHLDGGDDAMRNTMTLGRGAGGAMLGAMALVACTGPSSALIPPVAEPLGGAAPATW